MSNPRTTAAPPTVWESHDEGETWGQIGGIDPGTSDVLSLGFSMTRLDDGTLLVPVYWWERTGLEIARQLR